MAESKYGRLFTEADVRAMLTEAACDAMSGPGQQTAGAIADRVIATSPTTFPADEPLFVLRGQDGAAPRAIATQTEREQEYGGYGDYYTAALAAGADEAHLRAVERAAVEMYAWQQEHPDRVKVPDS